MHILTMDLILNETLRNPSEQAVTFFTSENFILTNTVLPLINRHSRKQQNDGLIFKQNSLKSGHLDSGYSNRRTKIFPQNERFPCSFTLTSEPEQKCKISF